METEGEQETFTDDQKKKANNLLQLFGFRQEALKTQRNQGFDEAAEFHSQIRMMEIQIDELIQQAERNSTRIELLEDELSELREYKKPYVGRDDYLPDLVDHGYDGAQIELDSTTYEDEDNDG